MVFSESKSNLVSELFVRRADENYVTACWCAINQLNTDFLWLAIHALEKYLKAVLLVNGRSSKGFGHNVVTLNEALAPFTTGLLPAVLQKPDNLHLKRALAL
jgi:hypothetical protein